MAAVTEAYLLPGKWSSQMALISGMMYRDPHPSVQGLMQKSIESFLGEAPQHSLHPDRASKLLM